MKDFIYLCRPIWRVHNYKTCLCIIVCLFFLSACKDRVEPKQEQEKEQQTRYNPNTIRRMSAIQFPSTSTEELTSYLSNDAQLICPIMAFAVATHELQNGKYQLLSRLRSEEIYNENFSNECHFDPYDTISWHLTENPRVILDFDGSVKYYEYGLVENDEVTSTITVYAKREAPFAIAYMFPYTLSYDNSNYNYYVGEYPYRVFFDGTGYRPVENSENWTYINYPRDEFWSHLEEQLPTEEVVQLENLRLEALEPDIEFEQETTAYWNTIENVFISVSQESGDWYCPLGSFGGGSSHTINNYVIRLRDSLGTNDYCRDYTARPYCDTRLQQTHWSRGCGPAALAWIYRGLRGYYPQIDGEYLPVHGDGTTTYFNDNNANYGYYQYRLDTLDSWSCTEWMSVKVLYMYQSSNVDNGLTANFYNYCIPAKDSDRWQFFMAPWNLGSALSDATDGIFTVLCDCDALDAADWIYLCNLPVLIVERGLEHYIVAYGYGGISDQGEPIPRKNLYFLIMDNGYEIRGFGYKPFWRAYQTGEFYHRVVQS